MSRARSPWPLILVIGFGAAAISTAGALFLYRVRQTRATEVVTTKPLETPVAHKLDGSQAPIKVVPLATPDAAEVPLVPVATPDLLAAQPPEPPPFAHDSSDDESDGADEDVSAAPAPPPAAPRRETHDVSNLGDVRVLIRRGETDLALAGLYQLRRKPGTTRDRQAQISLLLGHLYMDRRWISDSLKEYRYALILDPRLRNDSTLVANTVRALTERSTAPRARRLILDYIGRAAIVPLRRLADRPDTRRRTEEILGKLGAPRR
jgi:hypothetical protein